jgi:hypothetical protein
MIYTVDGSEDIYTICVVREMIRQLDKQAAELQSQSIIIDSKKIVMVFQNLVIICYMYFILK